MNGKRVTSMNLNTVNRGVKQFIISVDKKGKYFAHEIGEKEQVAKVMNWEQYKAHRLNPTKRWRNQHSCGRYEVGMPTIIQAKQLAYNQANTHVQYF